MKKRVQRTGKEDSSMRKRQKLKSKIESNLHDGVVQDDQFSKLPEHLIHEIISLLPTKDSTQTSTLSRNFFSAWCSLPTIDIDYALMRKAIRRDATKTTKKIIFFDFVRNYLKLRKLDTCLEKFRFRGKISRHDQFETNTMIHFALKSCVRDLDFELFDAEKFKYRSISSKLAWMRQSVFSAKSIKKLRLKGFETESPDLILDCPLLEEFNLSHCTQLKSITIKSSNYRLKSIQVHECSKLNNIYIEPLSNLEFLSINFMFQNQYRETTIHLPSSNSLKFLELREAYVNNQWLNNIIPNLNSLEVLKIHRCSFTERINIKSNCLKVLEMLNCCMGLQNLNVVAPNLETFKFISSWFKRPLAFNINLSLSENIKDLQIFGANISDQWTEEYLPKFSNLENLVLGGCSSIEKFEFCFEHLKNLELIECENLYAVQVEAPNLNSLVYNKVRIQSSQ